MKKYHQTVDVEKHEEISNTYELGWFESILTFVSLGAGKVFIYVMLALFMLLYFL